LDSTSLFTLAIVRSLASLIAIELQARDIKPPTLFRNQTSEWQNHQYLK
jgi:hypothetical protein